MKKLNHIKKLTLLLFWIPSFMLAQQTAIPDPNFEQALIDLGHDNILDGFVLTSNINTLTYLQVGGRNISDLTGIEDFTALKWLDCDQNQITFLDLSSNIALEHLGCGCTCSGGNLLTSLDISNNINLNYLQCDDNQLTNLDLSNNPLLTYVSFRANNLTTLDVSNNTFLHTLLGNWNQMSEINLNSNPLLIIFDMYSNNISSIDITSNTDLEYFRIAYNQVSSLDLSNNTKITSLSVSGNPIGSLDVSNMPDLETLSCSENQLSVLDITNNPLLTGLHCSHNQLSNLDVSNNPLIYWFTCQQNYITTLDLRNVSALKHFVCNNNQLTQLNIANGNNINLVTNYPANPSASPAFDVRNNPDLNCITVDDPTYSINNWSTTDGFYIDPQHYYDSNCLGTTLISEEGLYKSRKIVKIINILGKEVTFSENTPLFYIYDDGTIEKKITIN